MPSFTNINAVLPVSDHSAAVAWYKQWIGRFDGDRYGIRVELPGIDPGKDVELTITDGMLRIHAERHAEQKDAHRSGFRYGSFTRSLALPAGVDAKDVKAGYDKGILEITVPMRGAKQAVHRVPVEQKKN